MITINNKNNRYAIAHFNSAVKKLNILVAEKTKKILQEVIDEGHSKLILSLNGITYIDSSGFGAIISIFNYAKNRDAELIICDVSEANMALIKITKLNEVFKIFDTIESAIDSIN